MTYLKPAPLGQTPNREKPKSVKKYIVTSSREVLGHKPGDVVTLELDEAQASSLVESGHLRPYVATPED